MSRLIVRADDLGISRGVNYGIYTGVKEGFIRAVGLMVNQEDAAHGFRLIREFEGISLGLHCNIVLGKPVTDPALIPSLVDKTYAFRSSRYYRAAVTDQVNYEEACMEIQNQIAAFRKLTGRLPDYVDYHAA